MKKILTLCIFLQSVMILQAQDSKNSFTLKQAVDYALTNQQNVKNAMLDEKIAQRKVDELVGIGTPQISGEADFNKFIEIPTSFVPAEFFGGNAGEFYGVKFGQPYTASAGVTATQLLFDGSYLVGLQASRTYRELSKKATAQTKTETAINVSKAYYGALVSDARLEIIQANIDRVTKLFSDTKALNQNGLVEKIDVDRIELSLNNLKVEKEKITRFKDLSYALLKFQMGFDPHQPITLSDKLDESVLQNVVIADSVDASKRPEFALATVQRKLQELDLKRYKSTYYPSLVAFGSASYNASRNEFNIFNTDYKWYPTVVAGLKLSIPIWDGLQKQAKISQARLSLEKVDNSISLLKNSFALEYESARSNYENNLSSLKTVKKNQELATEISRVSKIKYDNGVGSSLELVDAESSVKEADANYFNTLYDAIISKIDLEKTLGTTGF
ncbi:MAG TPA: TolC family protein [Bacteroidia bacterium]|jgi:outer membrane protein TolC|nr:TolC family protein [Bacteroidia bacterium]HQF27522.1 TolC family protein [Bacteroidia bacterium]HQK97278.1 TolC family protein [Bacteroidia bacterium]